MDKRGSEKYYIIISLILGLLILSISLYFIFKEYFDQSDIDYETCRQSIYLRAISPNFQDITDLKDVMPLKCKTEVINIDTAKPNEVYRTISDTVASGWYLFGEGKYDIVSRNLLKAVNKNYCMVFARIHFTDKAKEEFGGMYKDTKFRTTESMGAFINYYKTVKLKNSQQTYNDYLPIYMGDKKDEGYNFLELIGGDVNFAPNDNDLLLVYSVTKYPTSYIYNPIRYLYQYTALSYILPAIDPNKEEKLKSIVILHPEEIDKLECSEFLTIPA
jgi:hypothetical protein